MRTKIILILVTIFLLYASISYIKKNLETKPSIDLVSENLYEEMKGCYKANKKGCYKSLADSLFNKYDYPDLLVAMANIETRPEVLTNCHEVMHYLGRLEYLRTKNITETLTKSSPTCISGSYHGAIEGYFISKNIPFEDSSDSTYIKIMSGVCGIESDYPKKEIYYQCNHGIGHALMFVTQDDLPRSLKICDALMGKDDRRLCYTGVFMENSNSTTSDHPPKFIKDDDPMYPCNILEKNYTEVCYSLKASYFFRIAKGNWDEVIKLCQKVPEDNKYGCFYTIGGNQVGFETDPNQLSNNCEKMPTLTFRRSCIKGVTSHLMIRYSGERSYAINFCGSVKTINKQDCYTQFGESSKNWTSNYNELKNNCYSIKETEYIEDCLKYSNA